MRLLLMLICCYVDVGFAVNVAVATQSKQLIYNYLENTRLVGSKLNMEIAKHTAAFHLNKLTVGIYPLTQTAPFIEQAAR